MFLLFCQPDNLGGFFVDPVPEQWDEAEGGGQRGDKGLPGISGNFFQRSIVRVEEFLYLSGRISQVVAVGDDLPGQGGSEVALYSNVRKDDSPRVVQGRTLNATSEVVADAPAGVLGLAARILDGVPFSMAVS